MKDVIALTPKMPDSWAVVAGLYAGGPDVEAAGVNGGAVVQLRAADGRPLVSVEAPLLVHVPGEAERLLGDGVGAPTVPYWWTEVRASTALPEAAPLAGSVAGRLRMLLGGAVWPPEAASLDVVPVPAATGADAGEVTATTAEAGLAVDVLTDSTAVVLADRPVVPLNAWMSEILRTVGAAGLALQIVTPSHVRLSLPLRTALAGAPNRWVVQDSGNHYYDGLSGAELRWENGTFTPARTEAGETPVAKAFSDADAAPATDRQLIVSFRVLHEHVTDDLVLGSALRTAWTALTGTGPAGWGTAEPVNLPWSTEQLTALARERSPEPTHLLAVGRPDRPALATLRVSRTEGGVAEDVTLTLGYGRDETPPLATVEPLARTLADEHGLVSLLVSLRRGRRDLTVPPRFEAPPIPVSFTLGSADVRRTGLDHALRPPLDISPVRLGPVRLGPVRLGPVRLGPAVHYPLGDGTDAQAWTVLQRLSAHLKAARADD
ncbi:DUF6177 family protein [Streptomyces sp. NPDC037389]|uniref:DUF6177 family protein n=1 Tax=Streptomyces sp. NPDC037389 TaxID=3155369 RepID=UPI0033E180EF